jgi:hypothetical protein
MTFSAGMPILYFIAAISFTCGEWLRGGAVLAAVTSDPGMYNGGSQRQHSSATAAVCASNLPWPSYG